MVFSYEEATPPGRSTYLFGFAILDSEIPEFSGGCGRSCNMEGQEFIIRPLCPGLCGDWLRYFDQTAFQDHKDWAFCYCLEGFLDRKTQEEWTNAEERREKAAECIQTGRMQGYLAYRGDTVVGWCNVNERENYRYVTEMFQAVGYQPEDTAGVKVKTVFCFLIAPEQRGRGVAQRLLERVCADAAQEGYAYAEAYPFADEAFEFQYHGTVNMYKQCGFAEAAALKFVKVMRKRLL